jgi:predicted dehydrogenase
MQGAYMAQIERLRGRGLIEVVAAADHRESRRDLILRTFRIPRFSTDARDVIDADDVDLVMILTSIPAHARLATAALDRGKHVLVEKPMATTLEDARQLLEAARRSRGHLVCAPHVILSPTFQTLWWRLHRGEIGEVHLARARYGWAGPSWNEWFYAAGGGALFDVGVYSVTSLTGLLGPARRVMAFAGVAIPDRSVGAQTIAVAAEDNAQVLLDFGQSCFAVITTGFTIQQYRGPALELYGRTGTLQMLGDDWAPQGYDARRADTGAWQHHKDLDPAWAWTDGLRHLVECIRDGRPPLMQPDHAFHVLEIMLAAREAARTGVAQVVSSVFAPLAFEAPTADRSVHLMHDLRR